MVESPCNKSCLCSVRTMALTCDCHQENFFGLMIVLGHVMMGAIIVPTILPLVLRSVSDLPMIRASYSTTIIGHALHLNTHQKATLRRLAINRTRQTSVENPEGSCDFWMSPYCGMYGSTPPKTMNPDANHPTTADTSDIWTNRHAIKYWDSNGSASTTSPKRKRERF